MYENALKQAKNPAFDEATERIEIVNLAVKAFSNVAPWRWLQQVSPVFTVSEQETDTTLNPTRFLHGLQMELRLSSQTWNYLEVVPKVPDISTETTENTGLPKYVECFLDVADLKVKVYPVPGSLSGEGVVWIKQFPQEVTAANIGTESTKDWPSVYDYIFYEFLVAQIKMHKDQPHGDSTIQIQQMVRVAGPMAYARALALTEIPELERTLPRLSAES